MNSDEEFYAKRKESLLRLGRDDNLREIARRFIDQSAQHRYSYNFDVFGRPIIQYPQDIVAIQELIWEVRPDLIIETGIAHGGSLILSASMLALLDMVDSIEAGETFVPTVSSRKVLGIDIEIRNHNRLAIEMHPMASRIEMIQGSSIDPKVITQVYEIAKRYHRILVFLDSNHTHNHVLSELNAFAQLTSIGSYCVVFDTVIEDLPSDMFPDRPWGPGDNPKTAVREYLSMHPEFEIDESIQNKLLITVAPDGYLKRIA